jgi:hypothetical protein
MAKSALQVLTAAVIAFKHEVYVNTAREPKAIAVAFDDDMFDRILFGASDKLATAEPGPVDRFDLNVAGVKVIVRRHSGRMAARIAVRQMATDAASDVAELREQYRDAVAKAGG